MNFSSALKLRGEAGRLADDVDDLQVAKGVAQIIEPRRGKLLPVAEGLEFRLGAAGEGLESDEGPLLVLVVVGHLDAVLAILLDTDPPLRLDRAERVVVEHGAPHVPRRELEEVLLDPVVEARRELRGVDLDAVDRILTRLAHEPELLPPAAEDPGRLSSLPTTRRASLLPPASRISISSPTPVMPGLIFSGSGSMTP